ncbi:hypothetical protein N0B31_10575 [Salinirubellus salinus]|uniref:Uncharacterized protein n=1 Tax=Salinirubellus salinus TaxID=1364945 RepID=A0A9E7UD71_9EURY|nr:hypothetical protein [Salinirubellus salinus]UWM56719.1 hypothetical protein N0B31_10575 [Salinirubellus salinus]
MSSPTTSTPSPESTAPERGTERRSNLQMVRLAVFYLALVAAAAMTVLFLGELFLLLALGWTAGAGAELGIHRLHVMGIAAVVLTFVLGLFAQAYRPKRRVAAMWGSFLVILVVTAGTLGFGVGRPEEVVPFFVLTGVALLTHPAGRGLFRRGESYSPALLALVAVAAVPLLAFAVNQFSLSGSATDPHAVDSHYVMMAGLAVAPIAYGAFAAFGFAGWRLAAWLAALPMAYYGAMSIAFPLQSGSTGAMWGVAAILWAVAFVVVAEYARVTPENTTLRREFARAG